MEKKYLVSAQEMKRLDQYTIQKLHVPALVLMERAALSLVQILKKRFPHIAKDRILVVCGGGNNGGDGLAIARLLLDEGYSVDVCLAAPKEKCSQETLTQLTILASYGQKIFPIFPKQEYDIMIDAIFGVGLSREVTGMYAEWIEAVNASGAFVAAVDIPSGIHSDTGHIMGCAVRANLTVTFGFKKKGLALYPGREYAGEVICTQIGITERSFDDKWPVCFTYEGDGSNLLPKRVSDGNKGTFGKLLVVAGSYNMSGAALLCAESAYRTGAGMVKLVTCEANRVIVQTALPEALLLTYEENYIPFETLRESIRWADGIVAGPGMGMSETAAKLLEFLLEEADCPLILDADALNLLAQREELRKLAIDRQNKFPGKPLVMTPHLGELSRLTGRSVTELKEEPFLYANQTAEQFEAVLVSKDAVTLVCDGHEEFFVNTAGNSGLATAGSGDVLAGILGGFFVQSKKEPNLTVAAKGVYLHALAGDMAKSRLGEVAMLSGDLLESIKEISKEF